MFKLLNFWIEALKQLNKDVNSKSQDKKNSPFSDGDYSFDTLVKTNPLVQSYNTVLHFRNCSTFLHIVYIRKLFWEHRIHFIQFSFQNIPFLAMLPKSTVSLLYTIVCLSIVCIVMSLKVNRLISINSLHSNNCALFE